MATGGSFRAEKIFCSMSAPECIFVGSRRRARQFARSLPPTGYTFSRRPERGCGRANRPACEPHSPQLAPGSNQTRILSERFRNTHVAAVDEGAGVLRLQAQRLGEVRQRPVEIVELGVDGAPVEVGAGQARVEAHRIAEVGQRRVESRAAVSLRRQSRGRRRCTGWRTSRGTPPLSRIARRPDPPRRRARACREC